MVWHKLDPKPTFIMEKSCRGPHFSTLCPGLLSLLFSPSSPSLLIPVILLEPSSFLVFSRSIIAVGPR